MVAAESNAWPIFRNGDKRLQTCRWVPVSTIHLLINWSQSVSGGWFGSAVEPFSRPMFEVFNEVLPECSIGVTVVAIFSHFTGDIVIDVSPRLSGLWLMSNPLRQRRCPSLTRSAGDALIFVGVLDVIWLSNVDCLRARQASTAKPTSRQSGSMDSTLWTCWWRAANVISLLVEGLGFIWVACSGAGVVQALKRRNLTLLHSTKLDDRKYPCEVTTKEKR